MNCRQAIEDNWKCHFYVKLLCYFLYKNFFLKPSFIVGIVSNKDLRIVLNICKNSPYNNKSNHYTFTVVFSDWFTVFICLNSQYMFWCRLPYSVNIGTYYLGCFGVCRLWSFSNDPSFSLCISECSQQDEHYSCCFSNS